MLQPDVEGDPSILASQPRFLPGFQAFLEGEEPGFPEEELSNL